MKRILMFAAVGGGGVLLWKWLSHRAEGQRAALVAAATAAKTTGGITGGLKFERPCIDNCGPDRSVENYDAMMKEKNNPPPPLRTVATTKSLLNTIAAGARPLSGWRM